MKLSAYAREIYNNNLVIAANTKYGTYVKTNANLFQYIKSGIIDGKDLDGIKIQNENTDAKISAVYKELVAKKIILDDCNIESFETEYLEDIIFSVTNNCNLACIHCCVGAGDGQQFEDLSLEDIKVILDSISLVKPKRLQITGGEPLLRKDILDILKYIKSVMDCKVTLSTNLTVFDMDTFRELIEYVDHISVSLDGFDDESVKKIRGENVFHLVMENLQKLKSLGFQDLSLSMVYTKYVDGYDNIEKFTKLCADLAVMPLVRIFFAEGRAADKSDLNPTEFYYVGEKSEAEISTRVCNPAKRELYIDYKGDVYPCQLLIDEKYKMGNTKDLDLNNLSNDCIAELMPFNNECKDCPVHLFCYKCIAIGEVIRRNSDYCMENKKYLTNLIWKTTN